MDGENFSLYKFKMEGEEIIIRGSSFYKKEKNNDRRTKGRYRK